MIGTVAISFLALLTFVLLQCLYSAFKKGLRQLPGPWAAKFSIFYRVSMVFSGKAIEEYRHLHEEYGRIVRVGPYHVSINDPDVLQKIYGISSQFQKSAFYSVSPPYYEGKQLDNMFTVRDSKQHRVLRSATAQVYSMTNLRHYEPHVDECVSIFTELIKKHEGEAIDMVEYVHWFAWDVIASITFQKRFGFLDNQGDVLGLAANRKLSAQYLALMGQVPWLHPYLLGNRRMMQLIHMLFPKAPDPHGTLFKQIEEQIERYDQEERQSERKDFLQQLRLKDDRDRVNHRRDLMNHLSNNVLAGSDTTAIAIRAILYYLVKTPRAYNTLKDEILGADQAGMLSPMITYEESQNLRYLQLVIKEAMRLHPSIGFPLERVVPAGGAELCGQNLPEGTIVGVLPPLINRNREVFGGDSEAFRPERWSEASPDRLKLMERTYTTFGHGSRGCIGKNIAMLEISKFIPELIRRFNIEWALGSQPWTLRAGWFWRQQNVKLIFRSREQAQTQ